jgi:hypothetical protein
VGDQNVLEHQKTAARWPMIRTDFDGSLPVRRHSFAVYGSFDAIDEAGALALLIAARTVAPVVIKMR